jgi:hypothetical protein
MTKQPRKTRYSSSNCIHDIIGLVCNYFLSYHDPGLEYVVEIQDDQFQPDEPQETKPQIVDHVYTHTVVEILDRHKPPALFPTAIKTSNTYVKILEFQVEFPDSYKPFSLPLIPVKVPDRYKPLFLPPILHDLPVNYNNNLPRFDGENANITVEKHIQRLEDFLDLFEVEEDNVCIRMFSLSLLGKVKDWCKNLPAASISNFCQFVQVFLDRWVIMGKFFHILEEYDHLKRKPGETVQQFSTKFNKVYHSIPVDVRPPPSLAQLHYPDAFDPEMTFQLRETDVATLEEMKNVAIDVEANLLHKRSKLRAEEEDRIEKE